MCFWSWRGDAVGVRCDFGSRCRGQIVGSVRVAADAPASLGRLGEQNPGALCERCVASLRRDDGGQFPDDAELLVSVQYSGWGQDLYPDVVASPRDVRNRVARKLMDEGSRVVAEE